MRGKVASIFVCRAGEATAFSSPNGLIVLRRSFRADFNHISQTDSLKVYLLMINGVPQIQYMNPKLY